jgi:23S rRNA pseudouridine1911/1915/1917 synthase
MKFGEERPGIVHRLDKETSGLLVVAKNDFAHENLAQQFRVRKTHRIYEAIVFGKFKNESGVIESFLARHPTDRKKYASVLNQNKKPLHQKELTDKDDEVGKWAITNYKVLQNAKEFSFVQLKLETGRTHQIRVHLSELGHPIIGDSVYGANKRNTSIKNQTLRKNIEALDRFALHAKELGFFHPRSQEWMFFSTPWSDDMKTLIQEIGFIEESK